MEPQPAEQAGKSTSCEFPTTLAFLDRRELLVSGLGLGTHFFIEQGAAGESHLRYEYTYPTSDLARSLAVQTSGEGLKDSLTRQWAQAHPELPVRLGDSLAGDASVAAAPQGMYLSARSRGGARVLERRRAWDGDRPYMVRSISKAFASTMLLALNDAGILSIDDRISSRLPEFAAAPLDGITLRMALTHTAGFAPFMAQVGDASPPALTDPHITLRESAAQIAAIPLVSPPGAEFHYTELGYQVAGAFAEVAAGKSWYALFQELVAGPLELRNTRWYNTFSAQEDVPNPLIAIGAVTCGDDLNTMAAMMLDGGVYTRSDGSTVRVLSEASVEDLTRPQDLGDTTKDAIFAQNSKLQSLAQPLADAGLITNEELAAVGEAWGHIGYGLGAWLGHNPETGIRHVFFLGAYTGVVSLLGWGSPAPLATVLMSYSKSNPSHAVLAGLCWRDWVAGGALDAGALP